MQTPEPTTVSRPSRSRTTQGTASRSETTEDSVLCAIRELQGIEEERIEEEHRQVESARQAKEAEAERQVQEAREAAARREAQAEHAREVAQAEARLRVEAEQAQDQRLQMLRNQLAMVQAERAALHTRALQGPDDEAPKPTRMSAGPWMALSALLLAGVTGLGAYVATGNHLTVVYVNEPVAASEAGTEQPSAPAFAPTQEPPSCAQDPSGVACYELMNHQPSTATPPSGVVPLGRPAAATRPARPNRPRPNRPNRPRPRPTGLEGLDECPPGDPLCGI